MSQDTEDMSQNTATSLGAPAQPRAKRASGFIAVAVLAASVLALLVLVPSALARTTRPYESSFGNFRIGDETSPAAIAVDQSSGDIYGVAQRNQSTTVLRFSAAGAPHDFSVGPNAGSNALTGFRGQQESIALDNSAGPLAGDLYVGSTNPSNGGFAEVKVFAPSGAELGKLAGNALPGGKFSNVCGVAVDPSDGNLYVVNQTSVEFKTTTYIWRYAPTSPSAPIDDSDYALIGGIRASVKLGSGYCSLAADAGNVYLVGNDQNAGFALHRFASSEFTPAAPEAGPGEILAPYATAVTVDHKTGEIYVDEGNHVGVFDEAGASLYEFGAAAYFGANSRGIAVKSAASGPAAKAYLSDTTSGKTIDVFGPPGKAPSFTHDTLASFGPDGTSASSFLQNDPSSLGFDSAAERLYAASREASGIYGFDASSPPAFPPAPPFSPLGTASPGSRPGLAVDNTALGSAGNHYLASTSTNLLYGFNSAGSPLAGFPVDPASAPGAPAGSPKELCGAAVDPAGNVWVSNSQTSNLLEYSSAGAFVKAVPTILGSEVQQVSIPADAGNFRLSAGAESTPDLPFNVSAAAMQAALEALPAIGAGNVSVTGGPGDATASHPYIVSFQGALAKKVVPSIQTPSASASPVLTREGQISDSSSATIAPAAPAHPCGIAFAPNGDLYLLAKNQGLYRYSAASAYTAATQVAGIQPNSYNESIAVDPTDGHLLLAGSGYCPGGGCPSELSFDEWVDEYDASGNLVDEYPVDIAESSGSLNGIALDPASGNTYLSAGPKVRVIGPGYLLPEPRIKPASALANTTATLNGAVSTQEVALSGCHFEYVSEAAFRLSGYSDLSSGGEGECEPGPGSIPLDLEDHPVSAPATGLSPNTTYRYRLLAANASGETSAQGAFTTTSPPLVETTGAPVRSATTARLSGRVYPVRAATSYHFEYGSEGPCASSPCASTPAKAAGSGDEFKLVAEEVEGLEPNTTYHYRVVADNGNPSGPAAGADTTVTTRASEAPLSHGNFPGPPGSDRAYEMVSIADSGGNPVLFGFNASSDGDRATYGIAGGTPIAENGQFDSPYFSQRPPGAHPTSGWQTKLINPPRVEGKSGTWFLGDASEDLSAIVGKNGSLNGEEAAATWLLHPLASPQYVFQPTPPQRYPDTENGPGEQLISLSLSADFSLAAAFLTEGSLDPAYPAAASTMNLYDVSAVASGGTPKLLSLMPDGNPSPCGTHVDGNASSSAGGAFFYGRGKRISADGSIVYFPSRGNDCSASSQIYLRDIEAQQTKLISGPPLSGPSCTASLLETTPEAAFFSTATRLAADDGEPPANCANGQGSNNDIYRYQLSDGALKCLTCLVPGLPAEVSGNSPREIAVSADGSRIYFATSTHLLPGVPASGEAIYRLDVASGNLAYIAPMPSSAGYSIGPASDGQYTPDGSRAVFVTSSEALDPLGGATDNAGTTQAYLYDDHDRSLTCVSCPLDGSPPLGPIALEHQLAATGDFAFSTPTPLVAADQNTPPRESVGGEDHYRAGRDVYEWRDGRQLLVTDGLSAWSPTASPVSPEAITPSGHDIFFIAPAAYTADAIDANRRLYDARIGGGIDFPPPPKPCPLEVCQGTPKGSPEEQAPSSADFRGSGNKPGATPSRCRKGKVRRKGRCVSRHGKARHHQKRNRTANHNRRADR